MITALVAVALGTGGYFWVRQMSAKQDQPAVLTPEAKAYVRSLKISDAAMKSTASYMGHAVVEVTGNIRNDGGRPLDVVEIYCSFHDPYGQLVLRQKVPIVSARMDGLKPGETKPFRLPFDTIPDSWNQQMPGLVIAQVQFGK